MLRKIGILALVLLSMTLVSAQDDRPVGDGRGVIVETSPFSGAAAAIYDTLIPFVCPDEAYESCERVRDFLFPTLYDFDAVSGEWVGAQSNNTALVLESTPTLNAPQTLRIRQDLIWNDGISITAYDVLFTLLGKAIGGNIDIDAIHLEDDYTLTVSLNDVDCSTSRRLNTMVYPSHVVSPNFRAFIDEHRTLSWIDDWTEAYQAANIQLSPFYRSFSAESTPTGGLFTVNSIHAERDIRLVGSPQFNPDIAFVYTDPLNEESTTEAFLRGDSNLLVNPPYDRRDDLRTNDDIRIDEMDSYSTDWLVFNLSDPNYPRSGYGGDGELLEQVPHPIFNDIRVRQAVQMAIDVDQIIETVFYGNAVPVPSYLPPVSWAYNADLQPIGYDPIQAAQLLFEAGWRDTDEDGVLECVTCAMADLFRGRVFSVSLGILSDETGFREQVATLIAVQLRRVGINANVNYSDGSDQTFDLLIAGHGNNFATARDPNQWRRFSRTGDQIYSVLGNVGSYINPRIEELFNQARTIPDCNREERAAIYHEIQAILQADLPAIWLYARREMVVSRGITGIAPRPGDVFWNVLDWRVNQ